MGTFPFGAPIAACGADLPVGQYPVVVLGAYPSALHVRWVPPMGFGPAVAALPVDNEPTPFWDGHPDQLADLFARWESRYFRKSWGTVTPAQLNGPSGRHLESGWLRPLGYTREQAFITDCLATARASTDVARRLADRYEPVVESLSAPMADLEPHPSEDAIVNEALTQHESRLINQILAADPEIIISLGNAAARVLASLSGRPDKEGVLTPATYGDQRRVNLRGHQIRWQALVHPATPKAWAERHVAWTRRN
jgi:uracil-DNA glycosylase